MIKIRVCHIFVVLLTYSCHNYLQTRSRQGLCMFSIEAGITQQEIVILNEFHQFVLLVNGGNVCTRLWRDHVRLAKFQNGVFLRKRSNLFITVETIETHECN